MSSLPTLEQLALLSLLAEHKSLSKAADSAQLSESDFKHALDKLEVNLKTRLVEWEKDCALFTALGDEVILRARKLLSDTADLVATCQQGEGPFGNRLRIGIIPTVGPFLLPPLLQQLRHHHPSVRLQIREEIYPVLLEGLAQGRLDLIISANAVDPQDNPAQLESMVLFRDDFLLACQASHSFAQQNNISIEEIQPHELVLLEEGNCLREQVIRACKISADNKEFRYQATNMNTLVQSVANGLGITLLPNMAKNSRLLHGTELTTKPFKEENIFRSITITWKRDHTRSQEIKKFGEFITALFSASVH